MNAFKKSGMQVKVRLIPVLLLGVGFLLAVNCKGPSVADWETLEAEFKSPPNSAKPRVWWHWMNGNVTKEGIESDLLWMDRTGIGGFQNFDAGLTSPQIVENRLVYMTPEWKEAFRFTTELADSLGLEMAIAGSPGWSESGGPWVPPEEAMKKYVWSELRVTGGEHFTGILPQPPSATGAFQNLSLERGFSAGDDEDETVPEYYKDDIVIAFKVPEGDVPLSELNPNITSSDGNFNLTMLTDGDITNSSVLAPAPVGQDAWIQYEFDSPQTMQAVTFAGGGGGRRFGFGGGSNNPSLEASDDGQTFYKVIDIPRGRVGQTTLDFDPVTASYFRVAYRTLPPPENDFGGFGGMFGGNFQMQQPAGTPVAEFVLYTSPRVNRFEEKAAFATATDLQSAATKEVETSKAVSQDDVIDLTANMQPDGTLDWDVPEGNWTIIRLGYSLTGHQNSPASPEATGLEVDKLNPDHVKAYFNNYLDQYKDATGGLMGDRGLKYIITDSWEAGTANWTDNMISEFNNRNGYDIRKWVPVLAGRIVESAEASDKFLWDFRVTLGEMVAEYHYDNLTEILHERNMGRYTESHEGGRAFIGDGMEVKRTADVPMSATWTPGGFGGSEASGVAIRHKADVRESASVAHIYGQNLVAAESMTAIGNTWAFSPERLKPTADMELASGLNRFVIHTSVHQPVDDKIPGLGLGPFGQWFTRHETWAEQALPWTTYLARSCYLLQQGEFVADVVYLYGEDQNITALFGSGLPDVPEGYEFDFVNANALVHELSVKKNQIYTSSGMHYRLLAIDSSAQYMSLPVLKKIKEFVEKGAVVVGPKPIKSPSQNDDESEFASIADELWGMGEGIQETGNGKVYAGSSILEVLNEMAIEPDFAYTKQQDDTEILYVHRTMNNGDIYWLNNRNNRYEQIEATFRVSGRIAEIWNPETGEIGQTSYSIDGEKTTVPLNLKPNDAVFIVFRNEAQDMSLTLTTPVETPVDTIQGPWVISFQSNRGAPESVTLDQLTPWNENSNPGVKYFSGIGTYTKTFEAPAEWLEGEQEIWLDLGEVKNLAEISLNGQPLGIVWKTPFKINMTDALTAGQNDLEIRVVNLWVNRLIGDQQPGVTNPITYTTQAFYQADSPLLPSGLLGPVQIVSLK